MGRGSALAALIDPQSLPEMWSVRPHESIPPALPEHVMVRKDGELAETEFKTDKKSSLLSKY